MSLEGERDGQEPPAASHSWPRASWTRSEELAQYRCAGQRAARHKDGAAPAGSGRAAAAARSGDKSGKKHANLKEMGRGNSARHTRHLGNFIRGSLCVGVVDRKGQAGLAEPFRNRRDLRERRYCALLRLLLASFSSVSALTRDNGSSPAHFRAATGTRAWRRLIAGRTALLSGYACEHGDDGATKLRFRRRSAIEPRGVGGFAPVDLRRRPPGLRTQCLRWLPPAGYRLLSGIDGDTIYDIETGIDKLARQISSTSTGRRALRAADLPGRRRLWNSVPEPR